MTGDQEITIGVAPNSSFDVSRAEQRARVEAIGYRQAVSCLNGQISLEEAVESTCTDTRRYAKRQMTWFRKETDLHWISAPGENQKTLAKALELVV